MFGFSLFELSTGPHLHYQNSPSNTTPGLPPVETIVGNGNGWAKEVNGPVHVKPVDGRITLRVEGAGGMKINGGLTIGG